MNPLGVGLGLWLVGCGASSSGTPSPSDAPSTPSPSPQPATPTSAPTPPIGRLSEECGGGLGLPDPGDQPSLELSACWRVSPEVATQRAPATTVTFNRLGALAWAGGPDAPLFYCDTDPDGGLRVRYAREGSPSLIDPGACWPHPRSADVLALDEGWLLVWAVGDIDAPESARLRAARLGAGGGLELGPVELDLPAGVWSARLLPGERPQLLALDHEGVVYLSALTLGQETITPSPAAPLLTEVASIAAAPLAGGALLAACRTTNQLLTLFTFDGEEAEEVPHAPNSQCALGEVPSLASDGEDLAAMAWHDGRAGLLGTYNRAGEELSRVLLSTTATAPSVAYLDPDWAVVAADGSFNVSIGGLDSGQWVHPALLAPTGEALDLRMVAQGGELGFAWAAADELALGADTYEFDYLEISRAPLP